MAFIDEDLTYVSLETTCPFLTKFLMIDGRYKLMKIHQHFTGHMTKIAAIFHIKTLLKSFFQEPHWADLIKRCTKQQRPKLFMICANYGPWLTLTYFMARSNFAA